MTFVNRPYGAPGRRWPGLGRARRAELTVDPGAAHGITDTPKAQVGNDLLDFINK